MYYFAGAAIQNTTVWAAKMTESYFATVLEAAKCEINMSAGLVSPEVSFLGLWITLFSLCAHMIFPLLMYVP